MQLKLFLFLLTGVAVFKSAAQNPKVVRKGMPPVSQVNAKQSKAFYDLKQFDGKWQEIKRTPLNSKAPIAFSDTLLMQFHDSTKVEIRDATSMRMTMKGDAYIDPPYNLVAAGDEYIIRAIDF